MNYQIIYLKLIIYIGNFIFQASDHNFIVPKLDNLEVLTLFNCNLPNNTLQYLNHLKKLYLISINKDISDNKINLENCINLTELVIFDSTILESSLQNLINLEKLTLVDNTKEVLQYYNVDFSNLSKLKYLNIRGISIDKNNFNKLPNLEELYLFNNKDITGECLLKLINLKKLIINDTNIKDEYLINL
ncbi:hypothetical protein ABK040_000281 [Willaertia magna]